MTSQDWAGRLGQKGQLSAGHGESDRTYALSPAGAVGGEGRGEAAMRWADRQDPLGLTRLGKGVSKTLSQDRAWGVQAREVAGWTGEHAPSGGGGQRVGLVRAGW